MINSKNFYITEIQYIDDIYRAHELIYDNLSPKVKPKHNYSSDLKNIICNQNAHHLIALYENKIVGTGSIFFYTRLNGQTFGQIEDLVVDAKHRGFGIGASIIEKLINYAEQAKCYKVVLSCSDKNINYYEKFGFKQHENYMRLNLKDY